MLIQIPKIWHKGETTEITCIHGDPWKPIDDLANVWDKQIVHTKEVGSFTVDHWRVQDRILALQNPPKRYHGEVHVTVWHADVDPVTRQCDACGWIVGTPKQ